MSLNTQDLESVAMASLDNSIGSSNTPTEHQTWVGDTVRRLQEGSDDDRLFADLFFHYEPACRRLLSSLVPEREVDDLVQEVMVRVFRGIKAFRLDASLDTWIVRIVKNVAKNAHRDRNSGKAKAQGTSLETFWASDDKESPLPREPSSEDPGPLDQVLESERVEYFEAALRELPPRMRQCLELHHLYGYKYREIAAIHGVSSTTVKKQVLEARKRLRPALSSMAGLFGVLLLLLIG